MISIFLNQTSNSVPVTKLILWQFNQFYSIWSTSLLAVMSCDSLYMHVYQVFILFVFLFVCMQRQSRDGRAVWRHKLLCKRVHWPEASH